VDEETIRAQQEAARYKALLESQRQEYEERLRLQREASKFYNKEGFWLAFWVIMPLILLALGFNI
jgi:hypothetical protein